MGDQAPIGQQTTGASSKGESFLMKRIVLFCFLLVGCATVKADAKMDWQAALDCAKVDPANAAIIVSAKNCIAHVWADESFAVTQCLADIAPIATWSIDEIMCISTKTGGK
jgi:hypothetical protein